MLNNNLNQKPRTRLSAFQGPKMPPLSLNLHTMPKTSSGNFKNWLFIGLGIMVILILVAYLLFSV